MAAINPISFQSTAERRRSAKAFHRSAAIALMLAFAPLPQLIRRMPNPKPSICRGSRSARRHQISSSGAQARRSLTIGPWCATLTDSSVAIERSDREPRPPLVARGVQDAGARQCQDAGQVELIDGSMPSAGIAVRVTSPNDYYLVRVSAFELRLSLLHIINGVAEEIAGRRRYHDRPLAKPGSRRQRQQLQDVAR